VQNMTQAKAGCQGLNKCRRWEKRGFLQTNHEALSRVSVPSVRPSRGCSRLKINTQRKDTSKKR